MNSLNKGLLLMLSVFLGACAGERAPQPVQTGTGEVARSPASWREGYLALGKETYERSCASCHDAGVGGAPTKGHPETWSERSPLWSAVLLEHAKSGYLEMPPKGGSPELTDRAVEAAGEYLLSETFPDRPVD